MHYRTIMHTISRNLRYLRSVSNLTQTELALLSNVSRSSYAAYERGTQLPSIITLKIIADFYNISLDLLLDEKLTTILSNIIY